MALATADIPSHFLLTCPGCFLYTITPGKICLTLKPLLYGSPLHTAALIRGPSEEPHILPQVSGC